MNRGFGSCLLLTFVLSVTAFAQHAPSRDMTDAQLQNLMNAIRRVPVSNFDRRLPAMEFEKWLQTQVDPDGKIGWGFLYSAADNQGSLRAPDVVQANVMTKDRRLMAVVEIAVGHHEKGVPRVYRIDVMSANNATAGKSDSIEITRLGKLPYYLQRLKTYEH
ncbi:MAG TPA: hypothetical protein VGS78_07585 [Candidatus Sulfotelmatobacter sp.]|nr:hypothetical protein [Candidatus Sulfotelmatobacter sp.]